MDHTWRILSAPTQEIAGTAESAVEAASVTPAAGAGGPVRAEQTWGGAGAMCLQLDGNVQRHSGPANPKDDPGALGPSLASSPEIPWR